MIKPAVEHSFHSIQYEPYGHRIVILRVERAARNPTKFQRQAYIRIDSHLKPLSDHEDLERRLWQRIAAVD